MQAQGPNGGGGLKSRPARFVQRCRAHDHLYDPVYTASSFKDHTKVLRRQIMSSIERVPVFNNFFSESGSHPRHGFRLKPTAVMEQQQQQQQQQDVANASTGNGNGNGMGGSDVGVQTSGKQRYLFFNRPLIPYMQAMPAHVMLAPAIRDSGSVFREQQAPLAPSDEPKTRTIAVQTVYRETEAQTDPFSPEYVLDPDKATPEVLRLGHLSYADGSLPVGLDEVEEIEREQEKRAFEASLPELGSGSEQDPELQRRREVLLQEREMQEWQARERQIIEMEKARLGLIMNAIREREALNETRMHERLEQLRRQKEKECDDELLHAQKKRIKALRKVSRQRNAVNKRELLNTNKRDIIGEYANYASKVYAPMARDGKLERKRPEGPKKALERLSKTYASLVELEASMPAYASTFVVQKPHRLLPDELATRKGQAIVADLAHVDDLLRNANRKSSKQLRPLTKTLYKKSDIVQRPETPSVLARDTSKDRAALLLQRLLRGRFVQKQMYEGKQNHVELIDELCCAPATAAADAAEAARGPSPARMVESVLQHIAGRVMSWTLDFLSKEVVRRQQERHVARFVQRALDQRTTREAAEAGTRQAELIVRGKQEAHFSQIDAVNTSSVGFWVEDLLDSTVQSLSQRNAERRADAVLASADDAANESSISSEEVVQALVGEFLLPLVEKRVERATAQREQDVLLHASRAAVRDALQQYIPPQ